MLRPRWRKVVRDLGSNKTRTMLVVLSIAVGVFALGMITTARTALSEGLARDYAAINPSSALLMVGDLLVASGDEGFDDELVETIRRMRGVEEAEGRRRMTVRLQVGDNQWRDLQLFAIPDYDDIRINKVRPESGAWPPPAHAMLIERAALGLTQAQVGNQVVIKTPGNKLRVLEIAGLTHDLSRLPAFLDGTIYGYVTFDTLEWLGEPRSYNELHIVVAGDQYDKEHVQAVAKLVQDKVERSGRSVSLTLIYEPGKHPMDSTIQAIVLLLGVLGFLSLLLSGLLVATTMSAMLAQHIRQIGMLKAVGTPRSLIMRMYFALVGGFGLLALLVAVPLGAVGARLFSTFMAHLLNFNLSEFRVPLQVLALQAAVSLLVPALAALYPIVHGTRITVREAIDHYGIDRKVRKPDARPLTLPLLPQASILRGFSAVAHDGVSPNAPPSATRRFLPRLRVLAGVKRVLAGIVTRPLLLSLRNTFRRKGRLALTLTTLTLSGAIFIGVFSVRDSLFLTLDDMMQTWHYDVWVTFSRSYPIAQVEAETSGMPGVVRVESVGFLTTRRVRPDDTDSDVVLVFGLPPGSQMVKPIIVQGRWLLPTDQNAIVLTTNFLKSEPDITVGSEVVLKVDGREVAWRVVGVTHFIGPLGYTNYPALARETREVGRANTLWIATQRHDGAFQSDVAQRLERHYEQVGLRVSSIVKIAEEIQEAEFTFNIVVSLLAIMAVILAFVGGLGLMGTMSINVLERSREIGIMRAIGASTGAVVQLVLVEGILIGLISWLLSSLLALPLSKLLSDAVGVAFLQAPLVYTFSLSGMLLWLSVVVVLSALASVLPAWNAARLTVRDVLAYE